MDARDYANNIALITNYVIKKAVEPGEIYWTSIAEVQNSIKFRGISYCKGSLDEYGIVQNYKIYDDTNFFKDWFFLHLKDIQEYSAKYLNTHIVYSKDKKFYRIANLDNAMVEKWRQIN